MISKNQRKNMAPRAAKTKHSVILAVMLFSLFSMIITMDSYAKNAVSGTKLQVENISEEGKSSNAIQTKSRKELCENPEGSLKMESLLEVLSDEEYRVTYIGTWKKAPVTREKDTIGISHNGVLQGQSPVYSYSYTENTYKDGKLIRTQEKKETVQGKNLSLFRGLNGCELICNLKKDSIQYTPLKNGKEYTNHRLYLSYQVTREDTTQEVGMKGSYTHQRRKGIDMTQEMWSEESDLFLE